MSSVADLYTILRFYANKTQSPIFLVDDFSTFLEKYAKRHAAERPDMAIWVENTAVKVQDGLTGLSENGKCTLSNSERGQTVSVGFYFVDLVQHAYKAIEEMSELPFPEESSLKTVIPADQIRNLNLDLDFGAYLATPQDTPLPIIKLIFPEGAGTILLVSSMIPRKILEIAMLKARHHLRSHNNKEYLTHKLLPTFQGKESMLKDAINQLLVRPFDSMGELEKAGDFSYTFWAYLASLIKNDLRKKGDKLPEEVAVMQAMQLIEFFNNFYKGKIQRERETETAIKNLDLYFDKPPYYFTMDDIVLFTDTKGVPLLGQYSKEALEEFIRSNSAKSGSQDLLPNLLIIRGLNGERWYVKKTKLLVLCIKLLGEARPRIKNALTQRWFKLMSDFRSDAPMEDDEAFERELFELTESSAPVLSAILNDKTLFLVHEEMEGTETGVPEASRLFYKGAFAPLSDLYLLSRKDLLIDVRMLLPFWYSTPILSRLIAFFRGFGKKKRRKARSSNAVPSRDTQALIREEPVEAPKVKGPDRKTELKKAARFIEKKLIPAGFTLDGYLSDLEERWNRIIAPQAKADLTEDVNSLIRDYLRKTARTLRAATFTSERIEELARTLSESPNLLSLPSRDSLRLYIQLYMIKLILKS